MHDSNMIPVLQSVVFLCYSVFVICTNYYYDTGRQTCVFLLLLLLMRGLQRMGCLNMYRSLVASRTVSIVGYTSVDIIAPRPVCGDGVRVARRRRPDRRAQPFEQFHAPACRCHGRSFRRYARLVESIATALR